MIFRILIILFSLLGISATFMPWLHYPRANGIFYGYMVDGIITGIVFLFLLLYGVFTFRKKRFHIVSSSLAGLFALGMAIMSYSKIIAFQDEKINFSTDDPLISAGTAGFHEGIGIYVFGIAGLCLFITILLAIIYQFQKKSNSDGSKPEVRKNTALIYLFGTVILIAILISSIYLFNKKPSSPNKEEIHNIISQDISNMGEALAKLDVEAFLEYNHPTMIQSLGGRERTIHLLKTSLEDIEKSGTRFIGSNLEELNEIYEDKHNMQAVIKQAVIMNINGIDTTEIQEVLAVSEDGGNSWKYLSTNGRSKEEMKKYFPFINENIEF